MISPYRESLLSALYPGNQHSSNCLVPAVLALEERLALPVAHRAKIVWRLDRGFGGDQNIVWLLERGYQLLAKGCSNRRASALAAQVQRWQVCPPDGGVGWAPSPVRHPRDPKTVVLRYPVPAGFKYAYLFSTLGLSCHATATLYRQRGGAETEFRADKSGLLLSKRRKHKRDAQEVWVLLTDMAHNYLAWVTRSLFQDSPLAALGTLRLCRDLWTLPGLIEMDGTRLVSAKFLRASPYAEPLVACFQRFWQ